MTTSAAPSDSRLIEQLSQLGLSDLRLSEIGLFPQEGSSEIQLIVDPDLTTKVLLSPSLTTSIPDMMIREVRLYRDHDIKIRLVPEESPPSMQKELWDVTPIDLEVRLGVMLVRHKGDLSNWVARLRKMIDVTLDHRLQNGCHYGLKYWATMETVIPDAVEMLSYDVPAQWVLEFILDAADPNLEA